MGILLIIFASVVYASNNTPFVSLEDVDPSIAIEMRYSGDHNFVGRQIDGYEAPKCLLTKQAAKALAEVQKELRPFSLSLKVYDCYRPQRAVDDFENWAKDLSNTKMKKEFYPDVNKENLFRDGYIASKSSHSRGSTVDLTIVPVPIPKQALYKSGQKLRECSLPYNKRFNDNSIDMGTGFDCFSPLSNTANSKISEKQRINRLLLKTAMEKHGFVNYDKEWWHFTLKNEPFPDRYFNLEIK